MKESSLQIIQ